MVNLVRHATQPARCHFEVSHTPQIDWLHTLGTPRTWAFVALQAISRCRRHPSETGVSVVAGKNLFAGLGGPPKTPVDRECVEGDVAAFARGVVHDVCARRSQKLFFEDAPVARGFTSVAYCFERIRLPPGQRRKVPRRSLRT